jgi:hypothetical protein
LKTEGEQVMKLMSFDRIMRVAWLLVVVYAIYVTKHKNWMSADVGLYTADPIKLEVSITK